MRTECPSQPARPAEGRAPETIGMRSRCKVIKGSEAVVAGLCEFKGNCLSHLTSGKVLKDSVSWPATFAHETWLGNPISVPLSWFSDCCRVLCPAMRKSYGTKGEQAYMASQVERRVSSNWLVASVMQGWGGRKAAEVGPCVMVVRDRGRAVFGCYTPERWRPAPRYYGTGESFVFTLQVTASPPSPSSSCCENLFTLLGWW